jgi:transketolase
MSPAAPVKKAMRDAFIAEALKAMGRRRDLYFVTADFGAPALDEMRRKYPCRFVNVGIAEQNLVNVSAGMAFEGLTVHAYAIASFLATRAFEQVKINLSLHSQVRDFNVNLVGVGAGLSYDISGPTHHCLEDISVVNTLPGVQLFSPSDWVLAARFHAYALRQSGPKYLRFDSKPLPAIYDSRPEVRIEDCFCELEKGSGTCIVSTGFMTHTALEAARLARRRGLKPGVVDLFLLKPLDAARLLKVLSRYKKVVTLEEGFVGKGGMDSIISALLRGRRGAPALETLGFGDRYVFERGDRAALHKLYGLAPASVAAKLKV